MTIDEECVALGREYAGANLRLDLRAPPGFIDAYKCYRGPKKRIDDYFQKKLLGLRLNAIKRGHIVDSSVTSETLQEITWDVCLVSLEPFTFSGQKPTNASVDRLVNEGNYALGNLAMFTQRVNRAKGDKSFHDVLEIVESDRDADNLTNLEWLRLLSLMYGAWNAYTDNSDPHLIPWCTYSAPLTIKTISQVTQMLILKACMVQHPEVTLDKWYEITEEAGQPRSLFSQFLEPLLAQMETQKYPPQSWLAPVVYNGFTAWYLACRETIRVNLKEIHLKTETKSIDEMVQAWARPNRKSLLSIGSS